MNSSAQNKLKNSWTNIKGRLRYNPLFQKKNNKPFSKKNGVALLMATTSLMIMVYIASQVAVDSTLEFIVNTQEINRIKAYYAARNSMDLALLRIKLYQQATQANIPAEFKKELEQIWRFPFAWPLPITNEMLGIDKDTVEEKTKEALLDASYNHQIIDEGSKIDVNDLASPSKTLRDSTRKQLLTIFESLMQNDEEFKKKYQGFNFEELINHMTDWMSDKNASVGGGDKRAAFSELNQNNGNQYPPNRGFRTLDEIRLIPRMNEELFQILSTRITIYGMKAINPNVASKDVLMSLDPGITKEAAEEADKRRNDPDLGGPFKGASGDECREDFKNFIISKGARINETDFKSIPFSCEGIQNFKIIATGWIGDGKTRSSRTITAIVMDLNKASKKIKDYIDKEKQANNPNPSTPPTSPSGTGPQSSGQQQDPLPKGRPRIVYWSEY